MTVTIDPERFRESFERYSRVGATDHGGLHRLALSDADREARDLFVADLEELGLEVRVDEVGNIFGRRPGREDDLAPVLIGSHLDSQPYGAGTTDSSAFSPPWRRCGPSRTSRSRRVARSRS